MTKDEIAVIAMQGIVSISARSGAALLYDVIAAESYDMAEAMLAERAKREQAAAKSETPAKAETPT
jgi:hypothetical protein